MRMVTFPRGPRPFPLHLQLLLSWTFLAVVFTATNVFAQDRVILFEPFVGSATAPLPGAIREIQITQGGRVWSVVRSVPLPPHSAGPAVALADGSRIAWLAGTGNSLLLVQYDATTARASIVDIGAFHREAFLVSNSVTPQLYVVEPQRVIFVDYRLQPTVVPLPGPKVTVSAHSNGSHLVLLRRDPINFDDEAVVLDAQTAATTNLIALGGGSTLRVSRNGRLYRHYLAFTTRAEPRIDALSLATGAVIARTEADPFNFFALDDSRGALVHDQQDPVSGRWGIVVRDATSLAVIGEFHPGLFNNRRGFSLSQTVGRTILMSSRQILPSSTDDCGTARVDIFDATTFALVNQIDLNGRCPQVVPLPGR